MQCYIYNSVYSYTLQQWTFVSKNENLLPTIYLHSLVVLITSGILEMSSWDTFFFITPAMSVGLLNGQIIAIRKRSNTWCITKVYPLNNKNSSRARTKGLDNFLAIFKIVNSAIKMLYENFNGRRNEKYRRNMLQNVPEEFHHDF